MNETCELLSPDLDFAAFCNAVKRLSARDVLDAVLLEMLEVNRLYGMKNEIEIRENGLPERDTAARKYYDELFGMLSLFGGSHDPGIISRIADRCGDLLDKFAY